LPSTSFPAIEDAEALWVESGFVKLISRALDIILSSQQARSCCFSVAPPRKMERPMTRIHVPSKRSANLTLWLGLLGAMVLAVGAYFFGHSHEEKKRSEKANWAMKPIPSDVELRSQLTKEQYHVTRENGSETLFHNPYWDNDRAGIYVDIITGEPLFSSVDKYDSGLGLPSFTKPIAKESLVEKIDSSHDMQRVEVRARRSDSHLGYVFDDPQSATGRRYGINSAALRFIPLEKLDAEGYADYLASFPKPDAQQPPAR